MVSWKARGLPKGGFGCGLAIKAKKGENKCRLEGLALLGQKSSHKKSYQTEILTTIARTIVTRAVALRDGLTLLWHPNMTGHCCNLGDLASNLGIGRPLARVTGWAKKVGSIKVFLEKINELYTLKMQGNCSTTRFSDDLVSNSW